MLDQSYSLYCGDTDAPLAVDKLTAEKEVIYVGSFEKRADGLKFSVDEDMIDHWVSTFDQMKKNGVDVPVPLEHTTDPERRRGTVIAMTKKADSKNRLALFASIRFNDEIAMKQFVNSDVSLYSPPSFVDGSSNQYHRPIRHVALTDYPVVNDLDGWGIIAASHIPEKKDMTMKELAKKLGVEFKDEDDDAAIANAIIAKFNAMKQETPKPEPKPEPESKPEPKKIAASLIDTVAGARKLQIQSLVGNCRISPAVAKDLEEQYCNNEAVSLTLSDEPVDDGFNKLLSTLAKNEKIFKLEEQTGGQGINLSAEKNPVIADAERRAKAAAGR